MVKPESSEPKRVAEHTNESWELQLEEIRIGNHYQAISKRGNAADYVEEQIRRSSHESGIRVQFRRTLRRFIAEWLPQDDDSRIGLNNILDLIEFYCPEGGQSKVLSLFTITSLVDGAVPQYPGILLREKALNALNSYYQSPTRPLQTEASSRVATTYDAYLELLRSHLTRNQYEPLAARRLFRLRELNISDEGVRDAFANNPNTLRAILDDVFRSEVEWFDPRQVRDIYEYYVAMQREPEFSSIAGELGAELEYEPEGVRLRFGLRRQQRTIFLDLKDSINIDEFCNITIDATISESRALTGGLRR